MAHMVGKFVAHNFQDFLYLNTCILVSMSFTPMLGRCIGQSLKSIHNVDIDI
jgi:hypothetical protein